jgi:hypothetical protein
MRFDCLISFDHHNDIWAAYNQRSLRMPLRSFPFFISLAQSEITAGDEADLLLRTKFRISITNNLHHSINFNLNITSQIPSTTTHQSSSQVQWSTYNLALLSYTHLAES